MVILSANAANTQRFILKALGETRITVSQGETQAVQYRLSNNSDQTRTLIMKPIQGISQQVGGDGGYCGKLTTLKSGQSCVLSLTINSGEIANVNNASPLLCESGANWFDDQVVTSESCIQPLPDEKLSVNVIPAGNASFSIKIKQPENDTIGVKTRRVKTIAIIQSQDARWPCLLAVVLTAYRLQVHQRLKRHAIYMQYYQGPM